MREEITKTHVMGLPCTHRLKRSALVKKRNRVRDKLVPRK